MDYSNDSIIMQQAGAIDDGSSSSKYDTSDFATLSKYFQLNVDQQEQLLSQWIIVTFTATTSALLFFHMVGTRTVDVGPRAASVFSIALIILALLYNVISLLYFVDRTRLIAADAGTEIARRKIRESQLVYGSLTAGVSVVQFGIVYLILQTALPEFTTPFRKGIALFFSNKKKNKRSSHT